MNEIQVDETFETERQTYNKRQVEAYENRDVPYCNLQGSVEIQHQSFQSGGKGSHRSCGNRL